MYIYIYIIIHIERSNSGKNSSIILSFEYRNERLTLSLA